MAKGRLRRDQSTLLWASLLAFVLWLIPPGRYVLLPLLYLNTHLHELCHALAAIGTGGEAHLIRVFASGSGVTPVTGGWLPVIASAGYVGSAVIGAGMIYFGRTEKGARATLGVLATALALSLLLFVRGDAVGILSAIVWIVVLVLATKALSAQHVEFAAQFLGVQQCLTAMQSILVLLRISNFPEAQTDARIMQDATAIPAMFWAMTWAGLSLLLLYLTLKSAWTKAPKT